MAVEAECSYATPGLEAEGFESGGQAAGPVEDFAVGESAVAVDNADFTAVVLGGAEEETDRSERKNHGGNFLPGKSIQQFGGV